MVEESAVQARPHWAAYDEETALSPVLRHARDAIVQNGYHGTTVRDIARRMGQTVPAIYYHYENKQAVLVALLDMSMDDLLERCREAEAEAGEDVKARFDNLVRCIVLYTANRPDMAFLDAEIRSLEPANRAAYVMKRDRLENMLARAITTGMEDGFFRPGDPRSHARAIISMLRGIANWYRPEGPLTAEDLSRQYLIYACRLVGASGS